MAKKQNIVEELRAAIRRAEKQGTTRYQIAKAAGITNSMMQRIANGSNTPRLDTAARIAEAIGFGLTILPKKVV